VPLGVSVLHWRVAAAIRRLTLPQDLHALLRRLRLPHIRAHAPEVIATAKAQRWESVEVLKALFAEEAAGRERSALATRRAAAGFPTGKTFEAWTPAASSLPAPTQQVLRTLEWVRASNNLPSRLGGVDDIAGARIVQHLLDDAMAAAAAAGTVACLTVLVGPWWLIAVPVIALTGWARVVLRDHTAAQHHVRALNCSRVPRRFPHPFPMTAREAVGRTDVQSLEHRRRGRLTELLSRQYVGPDARTEKMGL